MTTDPEYNAMLQMKDRLLEKMGEEGELDGNTIILRGLTEEEWSDEENRSLILDEPGADVDVEENGDTYTVYIKVEDL